MSVTVVRYRVKPEEGERNAQLVRAVYDELAALAPTGFRYLTMRDGDVFIHVAIGQMPPMDAFRRFQAGIADRCAEVPQFARELVGEYGFGTAGVSDAVHRVATGREDRPTV